MAMDENQVEMEQSIRKGAMVFGVIGFVIAGLLGFWLLGSFGEFARIGGAALLGASAGFGLFKWNYNSRADSAKCEKCSAAFSISRTSHEEVLAKSENKSSSEAKEDGSTEITDWVEDSFDVTDVHTCAKCGDTTVKNYTTTRRRDETTRVEGPRGLARAGGSSAQADAPSGVDEASQVKSAPKPQSTPPSGKSGRAGRS